MKNGTERALPDELGDSAEGGVDFSQFGTVLREHLWLIVLFALVGLFAGLGYVVRMQRTYLATCILEINSQPSRLLAFDGGQPAGLPIAETADAIVAGFKTRAFLVHVVESAKLTTDPLFLPPLPDGQPHSMDTCVDALLGMQVVMARRGTPFVDVGAMHTDPRVAARLADALAQEFINQSMVRRNESSAGAIKFLLERGDELKKKLTASEEALLEHATKTDFDSLNEKQDVVISRLKTLSAQVDEARGSRMRIETDYDKIRKLAGQHEKLLELVSVHEHPSVVAAQAKIESIETDLATLALRYTEKHPTMKAGRLRLNEAKDALATVLDDMPKLMQTALEGAKATEEKFTAALAEQTEVSRDLNKNAIPYKQLQREVETNSALHQAMLKRLGEAQIAKGVEQNVAHIFEHALTPSQPMQPKKSKILSIAIGAGLAIGIGLSFALHALDSSIRTVDQASHVTGLQVLGAIPRDPSASAASRALTVHLHPASPVAEAFRSLRASLQVVASARGRHIVVFTSAEPDEGKTFCTINTAIAFAQQGLRTLLIDADLRVSMVAKMLAPDSKQPGVTDFLEGRAEIGGAIQRTDVPNLSVMTAGTPAKQPAELLAGPVFGELLRTLRSDFDRIVIDSVPVLAVSDVLLISEHAELVCLVVRAGKTSRKCVLRARDMLTAAGAKPSGLLLNQIVFRSGSGYNRYIGKYGAPENYGKDRKSEDEPELEEAESPRT
jgi:capsular exopolysaccharide synthesis family protein